MAIVNATKSGNYSDTTVWSSGALPASGDTVRPLTYTVTVDQNVNIGSGIFEATGSGYFSVTAARTITANILSSAGHSGGAVVRCSHTTGTVAITGNVTGGPEKVIELSAAGSVTIAGNVTGGTAYGVAGVRNSSTGTISITGDVTGGSGLYAHGIINAAAGVMNVTGNAYGSSAQNYTHGLSNESSGTINITGNATAGTGVLSHGVNNSSTGTLNVTGDVTGSASNDGRGAVNASAGTITITGNATGGAGNNAVGVENSATGIVTVSGEAKGGYGNLAYGAKNSGGGTLRVGTATGNDYGPLGGTVNLAPGLCGSNSTTAVTSYKKLKFGAHGCAPVANCAYLEYSLNNNTATVYRDASTLLVLSDPASSQDLPATGDVRLGTVYASGGRTGTLAVPTASQVSAGVAVDNTVGTAVNTQSGVRAAVGLSSANLDAQISSVNGNVSTSALTAAQIRSALGLSSANLDTQLSSISGAILTAAAVRSALGLSAANLDTQLGDLPTALEIADALLKRSVSHVESAADLDSLAEVILAMFHSSAPSTTWTIKKTDDTDTFNTRTLTTDAAALPVTGVS